MKPQPPEIAPLHVEKTRWRGAKYVLNRPGWTLDMDATLRQMMHDRRGLGAAADALGVPIRAVTARWHQIRGLPS